MLEASVLGFDFFFLPFISDFDKQTCRGCINSYFLEHEVEGIMMTIKILKEARGKNVNEDFAFPAFGPRSQTQKCWMVNSNSIHRNMYKQDSRVYLTSNNVFHQHNGNTKMLMQFLVVLINE